MCILEVSCNTHHAERERPIKSLSDTLKQLRRHEQRETCDEVVLSRKEREPEKNGTWAARGAIERGFFFFFFFLGERSK